MKKTSLLLFYIVYINSLFCYFGEKKRSFLLKNDPIDVVITARNKGISEYCVDSIKKYGHNIRNVYIISPHKETDKAIWIDENMFPFTDLEIATHIFKDKERAQTYITKGRRRIGWYLQQLFKLYSPLIIPNISSNVLLLDSDVLFLQPVHFMNKKNEPLFCPGYQYHDPYFRHGKRLLPGFSRMIKNVSGIAHHMLIQRDVIENLFEMIESLHHKPAWEAICDCIELHPDGELHSTGFSEYEIYFNYFFAYSNQGHIRKLTWKNVTKSHPVWKNKVSLEELEKFKQEEYAFISRH